MDIIDVHIHGFYGLDTLDTTPEDVLKMAGMLSKKGVSGFLPAVYSREINDMRRDMECIKKAVIMQRTEGIEGMAEIIGIHLEGPFLNPKRCGSLDPKTFIAPTEYNFSKLTEGFEDIIKIITVAPELEGASKLIKKITDSGITVSLGHSDASYSETEAAFNAGARGITHIFNAMRPFHHREPGIAGFGLQNRDIYIEIIADLIHLHIKTLELIFKIKHPDRIIIVSDAVKHTGLISRPVNDFGRLIGGSMTVTQASENLIKAGFDRDLVLKCISDNPKRYIEH